MLKFKWKITFAYTIFLGITMGLVTIFLKNSLQNLQLFVFIKVMAITLFISSGFFFLWVHQITNSIEDLYKLTTDYAEGNYEKKMISLQDDEIGLIATNIQIMVKQWRKVIRENQRETSRISTILASMVEGVIAFDQVGKIILLNKAAEEMFNITEEKAYKRYFLEVIRSVQLVDVLKAILVSGKHQIVEIVHQEQNYRVYVAPILGDKNNNIQGAVMVLRNVTNLRRLEQIRTEFVANVSHELRTPLTSIKGYLETLLDGAIEDSEVVTKFLRIMESETTRLQRLIEDLLTISKFETGKYEIVKKPINLINLIKQVKETLEPVLIERKSFLNINIEEKLDTIMGNEDMLQQVFLNLLDNAIKYSPDESIITFKARVTPEGVVFNIIDQGIGIPADSLSRIFERFYRVDKARSRQVGGTGLGLSIVKHIVERHRGIIQVESEVGQGTIMTVFLPLA